MMKTILHHQGLLSSKVRSLQHPVHQGRTARRREVQNKKIAKTVLNPITASKVPLSPLLAMLGLTVSQNQPNRQFVPQGTIVPKKRLFPFLVSLDIFAHPKVSNTFDVNEERTAHPCPQHLYRVLWDTKVDRIHPVRYIKL